MSDRTKNVDRFLEVLANRRRRFCLYYLHESEEPISISDLAEAVEFAITPPEASVTDRILEEAVERFVHVHLPKLQSLGLVRVRNEHVVLAVDPPLPVRKWLSVTAAIELDATGTETARIERPAEEPHRR